MGLISEKIKVKWCSSNIKHYKSLGYKYTKIGDELEVFIKDLPPSSFIKVDCICDGCSKEYKITYNDYNKCNHSGKIYCNKCARKEAGKTLSRILLKKSKSFEQWCLENNRQDVLNRWDYKLNNCKPSEITYGYKGKKWFKCDKHLEHKSELKYIGSFTYGMGSMDCKQCNSFAQWCLDNNCDYILNRWDYKLNKISPWEVDKGSGKKFWFICPKGLHKSELKHIGSFTRNEGSMDCKQCNSFAQYLIDNFGSNALEKYWDYNKNTLDPWKIDQKSSKKIWIKCQEKDYHKSYQITCSNFCDNHRCPYCSSRKIHHKDSLGQYIIDNFGENILNKIWSDKNKKSPFEYSLYSKEIVWWKCSNNKHNDFKRRVSDSTVYNFRCPECSQERNESILQEKVRLYIESLGYTILHENLCTIIPKNPKTNRYLPFDNEIKELELIIEINGMQHYSITNFHNLSANHYNTTPEYELHYQKVKDRYKRIVAKQQGYNFLEIPYWTDNVNEVWKQLIDNKINEILHKQNKLKLNRKETDI